MNFSPSHFFLKRKGHEMEKEEILFFFGSSFPLYFGKKEERAKKKEGKRNRAEIMNRMSGSIHFLLLLFFREREMERGERRKREWMIRKFR